MNAASKNMYIDKISEMVNECNNTIHRSIKTKPVYVKPDTYKDVSHH